MANQTLTTDMQQVLDQRQVWFTNLLLLGFDTVAQEKKTKVNFCREMFYHINKKGMQTIVHYLFNRLDSHIAYEEFRDCWPVYDKKQEAQFRKVCANWLTRIAKEDPESKLPRLSASILMSPGGERFEQLLLRLTAYVLRIVCLREAKAEDKQVYLSSFITSPESLRVSSNHHILQRALQCHIIRHSQSVVRRLELVAALHEQWKQFVVEQMGDYRSLSRQKRDLEAQIKAAATTLSSNVEEKSTTSTPAVDRAKKQKMKTVRGFWKSLDEFLSKTIHEREVLDAIVNGNANKYTIDAKDVKFQIPDTVLHMYEAQLREGTVGNTFEGGKLNLLSLIQLWNCALQVMRDQLRECEVPSFKAESEYMTEVLQAHRVNLANSQNLKASLMEYQQSLQESIEKLESEIQLLRTSSTTHHSPSNRGGGDSERVEGLTSNPLYIPHITLPSLNLDLLPPSPQKSHDISSPDMKHLQHQLSHLSMPNDTVSTPEAVHNISQSIQKLSQKQSRSHKPTSSIPTRRGRSGVSRSSSTYQSRDIMTTSRQSEHSKTKREKSSGVTRSVSSYTTRELHGGIDITPRASIGSARDAKWKRQVGSPVVEYSSVLDGELTMMSSTASKKSPQMTPTHSRLIDSIPTAHDILATQIADAVADSPQSDSSTHTPEKQIHSLSDPLSALGTGAFISCDKIPRTPVSKQIEESSPLSVQGSPLTTTTTPATTPYTSSATPHIPTSITTPSATPHIPTSITTPSAAPHIPTSITTPSATPHIPTSITTPSAAPHIPTSITTPSATPHIPTSITTPSAAPHIPTSITTPSATFTNITIPISNTTPTSQITLAQAALSPLHTLTSPQLPTHALTSPQLPTHTLISPQLPTHTLISPQLPTLHTFTSPQPTLHTLSSSQSSLLDISQPSQFQSPSKTTTNEVSSPLISLSPSLPHPGLYPTQTIVLPSSVAGRDWLSFNSPKIPPLLTASPLKPSPPSKSLNLVPNTFTGTPLQTTSSVEPTLFGDGTPVHFPGVVTTTMLDQHIPDPHNSSSSPFSRQPVTKNSSLSSPMNMSSYNTPSLQASVSSSKSFSPTTPVSGVFNTPSESSFLLSSHPPTPPFLNESTSSVEEEELLAGNIKDTTSGISDDVSHSPISSNTERQVEMLTEGGFPPVTSEVNEVPRGVQMATPVHGSPPINTSSQLLSSDGHTESVKAVQPSSQNLLLANSTVPHLHSPLQSSITQHGYIQTDQAMHTPLSFTTSSGGVISSVTKTPSIMSPLAIHSIVSDSVTNSSGQLLIDFSSPVVSGVVEWRPLNESVDHSPPPTSPPSSSLPSTHNYSPKSVLESNQLNSTINRETGLFDENDSFLVPFSPQSDLSDD